MLVASELRVLVLGLGDPTQGNEGIGVRLARSLFTAFVDVDVHPASDFGGFSEILHDYDLVIVLTSLSYCGNVGHVALGSPDALGDGWGVRPAHTDAFASALSYARLMGHTLPRIEVVNVCVGAEEWPERGLSPTVASMYPGILGRVRALVKQVIREARHPAQPFGT
jgi:Ni,Fe-hydrogenase maturation factor